LDKFESKQADIPETMTSPIYAISKKMANSIKVDFTLNAHEALLQTLNEKVDTQAKLIEQLQLQSTSQ